MYEECAHYRNQIPQALLADLDSDQVKILQAHLADCPQCRREEQRYARTLGLLHSIEEPAVPKHFFVYGAPRANPLLRLLRNSSSGWQVAFASASLAVAAIAVLFVTGLQIRIEKNALILGYGQMPAPAPTLQQAQTIDTAALEARILQASELKRHEELLGWVRTLRNEIADRGRRLDLRQRAALNAALMNLETRIEHRLADAAQGIEARSEKSLNDLYSVTNLQRERDMSELNERITHITLNSENHDTQTDVILEALLQVAEQRMR